MIKEMEACSNQVGGGGGGGGGKPTWQCGNL